MKPINKTIKEKKKDNIIGVKALLNLSQTQLLNTRSTTPRTRCAVFCFKYFALTRLHTIMANWPRNIPFGKNLKLLSVQFETLTRFHIWIFAE